MTFRLILVLHLCASGFLFAQKGRSADADSLFINGNYTKAIEIYKQQSASAETYGKIARAYTAIGNYDESLANYEKAVEENAEDALLKYEYAKLLAKTRKFKKSSEVFNELMNIDYRNPNYHYELGLVLERLKDSTAMNRFRTAYDLDDTHQKAIYKIAKHFLAKRIHDLSHKYIDKGLESYENNVELISLKAQNYYWQESYQKAVNWFEKLLALGESSEFIYEKLSLSYYQIYEYEKAIEQRKKVLELNPYDAVSMYVIGSYYERINNFEEAENYIKKALFFMDKPLNAEYAKLGTIYNQQKRHKEAIEMFKIAVREDPSDHGAAFYLARTKEEFYADIDAKIKIYEKYNEQYPKSRWKPIADMRIKMLREEKFMKGTEKDSISKN